MSILIKDKNECCGCEACAHACSHNAIQMQEDEEGFRYPIVDKAACIDCGLCEKVCQYKVDIARNKEQQFVFGGHIDNGKILEESTSGGAFTAIVNTWCNDDYVVFGAEAKGLNVFHSYATDKHEIGKFRRSKYSQSVIGNAYSDAVSFLREGKKVLFSGTPCQIAGLKAFLRDREYANLLTVEVICEGVPSPLFIRKYENFIQKKYGYDIATLDYRYKDKGRWDYQVMYTLLHSPHRKIIKCDRWFNPFWSIWLNHLMSRPSCYQCPYTNKQRVADITLGDLWGVHLYCPDLYNDNKGASLIIAINQRGEQVIKNMLGDSFVGRELNLKDALKYQSPMRKPIAYNPERSAFLADLQTMDYVNICKKWAKRSSLRLLISKYVCGTNYQKVIWWKIKNRLAK